MSWNYRVVIEREPDLVNKDEYVESISFRDVYYDENGKPKSWGADPQPPIGETVKDLMRDISLMQTALTKPAIIIQDDEIVGEIEFTGSNQRMIKEFLKGTAFPEDNEIVKQFQQRAYGMHEYEIEEKKRELEHAIEVAKIQNDMDKQKQLIEAFKQFQREVEVRKNTEEMKRAMELKKYPF